MEPYGAQPRPRRFGRDDGPARNDQHVGIGCLDGFRRKRGIGGAQIAGDVADVRDGEEIVDVRPAPRRVERLEAHPDEGQCARRGQVARSALSRIEPAADRRQQPRRLAVVSGRPAQGRDRREIVGQRIGGDGLGAHTVAREIAQARRLIGDADDQIGIERGDRLAVDRPHCADPRQAPRRGRPVREIVDADDRRTGTNCEEVFGQRRRERDDAHGDRRRDREQRRDHRVDNSNSSVRPGAG